MDNGIAVILYKKDLDDSLVVVDERAWTLNMIASLEHVNFITISGQEYETEEGRLNLDTGKLEILVTPTENA
ncbi:hypothetical protein [Cohnella rhizosphaerae]|uniref:Uncharacterized protein n=1 Tax=Cohnella rhizosphaerae TaxID=1457232 RepID=A0A9X4QWK8_9BACL|nr:hypothetical protein [Cohnella rhizosphaerae]MDG0813910.1 hypothetical protein [Cohnella rhizosphaerae]